MMDDERGGNPDLDLTPTDVSEWTFHPILDSYPVVVGTILGLIALVLLVPAFERLTFRRRWTLVGFRMLAIVLLSMAMLRPTHISKQITTQPFVLAFLLDYSRSMGVEDATSGRSRWQAQMDAFRSAMPEIEKLAQANEIAILQFGEQTSLVAWENGEPKLRAGPAENQTDIGAALDEVNRRYLGQRLAGVILMTDGAQRARLPKADPRKVARDLARFDCPIFAIGFGLSREQSQTRDVAIENLPDEYTVFAKNELLVEGQVRTQGYVNQPLDVWLDVQSEDGNVKTLGPMSITPTSNSAYASASFRLIPDEPGQYKLAMRMDEQPGELVVDNNRLTSFLTVLEHGVRVLFVHGNIVSGQNLIARTIDASPDIQLDQRWADPRRRDRWPLELRDLDAYDVYLLADVDVTAIGVDQCRAMADAVRQGKGLMMMGGDLSFGAGGYYNSALNSILPVRMTRFERQTIGSRRPDLFLNGPIRIVPKDPHFVTNLAADGANRDTWLGLPPLPGANEIRPTSAAPVLLETESGEPMLVASEAGGRVLAFAAGTTSPWYRYGRRAEHRRFWRQIILWLARKDQSQGPGVWISMDQRRFATYSPVTFEAGVNDQDGRPMEHVSISVKCTFPDSSEIEVKLADSSERIGQLSDLALPGDYMLEAVASQAGTEIGRGKLQFEVVAQDLELSDPAADPGQLRQLAEITSDAGGAVLAPEQLPALIERIRKEPPSSEVEVQTKWQIGETSADAWMFFLVFVGALGLEWYLRKRWRLV